MPLRGLKVLEFAGLAPGPFAGAILSDFGANVTVIEQKKNVASGLTSFLSHGKKSICIDLKHPVGVEIVKNLVKKTDILIEPYRPGVMEKLGLGPNVLTAQNSMLIYARLNGYGSYGYYSHKAGHDINYLAMSGLLSMYGAKNQKPIPPVNFSEFSGGSLVCVLGILMAVIARNNIGKGQVIDASITEGISYIGSWLMRSQNSFIWGNPKGQNLLDGGMHFYDTYKTKDGRWMAVGALEPQFYKELIDGLGLHNNNMEQMDFEMNENNRRVIANKFKEKTQEEWCKIFDSKDACVTPILDINEVSQHPHSKSRKSFIENEEVIVPIPAPKLEKTPGLSSTIKSSKVLCGQHTDEVLQSIGYSPKEIRELKTKRVVYDELKNKL